MADAYKVPNLHNLCKNLSGAFLGNRMPHLDDIGMWVGLGPKVRMVTLMEVKGRQRSNGVNYVLWLPYLVKRSPDAS